MNPVTQLLQIFEFNQITENSFIAQNQSLGLPHIFGGQLMAQALRAAQLSLKTPRFAHSFQAHFLQAGNINEPLLIAKH